MPRVHFFCLPCRDGSTAVAAHRLAAAEFAKSGQQRRATSAAASQTASCSREQLQHTSAPCSDAGMGSIVFLKRSCRILDPRLAHLEEERKKGKNRRRGEKAVRQPPWATCSSSVFKAGVLDAQVPALPEKEGPVRARLTPAASTSPESNLESSRPVSDEALQTQSRSQLALHETRLARCRKRTAKIDAHSGFTWIVCGWRGRAITR